MFDHVSMPLLYTKKLGLNSKSRHILEKYLFINGSHPIIIIISFKYEIFLKNEYYFLKDIFPSYMIL